MCLVVDSKYISNKSLNDDINKLQSSVNKYYLQSWSVKLTIETERKYVVSDQTYMS